MLPVVLEQSGRGERAFDIYSRLLRERIVFLGSGVDDTLADSIVAQLLYLDAEDPEKDVQIYINSPGGSITAGYGYLRYDAANSSRCRNYLLWVSRQYGSIFAFWWSAKGKRMALPSSRIMIHQPLGVLKVKLLILRFRLGKFFI